MTGVQPDEQEIQSVLDATRPDQTVVVGTYNGHLNRGQLALVDALCDAQRKVIAVALRNPYDLPAVSPKAVSYTHLRKRFIAEHRRHRERDGAARRVQGKGCLRL